MPDTRERRRTFLWLGLLLLLLGALIAVWLLWIKPGGGETPRLARDSASNLDPAGGASVVPDTEKGQPSPSRRGPDRPSVSGKAEKSSPALPAVSIPVIVKERGSYTPKIGEPAAPEVPAKPDGPAVVPQKPGEPQEPKKPDGPKKPNDPQKPADPADVTRVDDRRFILEDNEIVGVRQEGKDEILRTGAIHIPEGIGAIRTGAFAHMKLRRVSLPTTLRRLDADAFLDNELTEVRLPAALERIGRGAFDRNKLSRLELPNPHCTIDAVFYNEGYVNILTANPEIRDEAAGTTAVPYERAEWADQPAYGSLVNRASVQVRYYDENDALEFETVQYSRDRRARFTRTGEALDRYFKIGERVRIVALRNDYLHLGSCEVDGRREGNTVDFHYRDPSKKLAPIEADKRPHIYGCEAPVLLIRGSAEARAYDFLRNVFAVDHAMRNISANLEIVNRADMNIEKAGIYTLRYRVRDAEGREAEASRRIYVEDEDVWYPHDFYCDGEVLVSLSQVGEMKFTRPLGVGEKRRVKLPAASEQGVPLKVIGSAAFSRLRLQEVDIPDGYVSVRPFAFDSTILESLRLPDSMRDVGERAFAFTEIKHCQMSSRLETIGRRAFAAMDLEEIAIPESVRSIGEGAFMNNFRVRDKSVSIPAGVKRIPENCFEFCRIKNLTLNEGLVEIADNAFGKNDLEKVTLPDSLENLADAAFKQNPISSGAQFQPVKLYTKDGRNPHGFASNNFQVINPSSEDEKRDFSEADFTFNAQGELILSDHGKTTIKKNKNLVIPDQVEGRSVEKIASVAFMSKKLESVRFPAGLKEIGDSAFYLNVLSSVDLSGTQVETIQGSAFYDNPKLQTLLLPDSLQSIGKRAFRNANALERVELPESLNSIGIDAFRKKGGKVTLTIHYSQTSAAFIQAHEGRTDFILEVLDRPQQTPKVSLRNTLTRYGYKSTETLEFVIPDLSVKPELQMNDRAIPCSYYGGVVYVSPANIRKGFDPAREEQTFIFRYAGKEASSSVRVFRPDTPRLQEPDQTYAAEDGLKLSLATGTYPYENVKAFRTAQMGQPLSGIHFSNGLLVIDKATVEELREAERLVLYVEADFHERGQIQIKLQAKAPSLAPAWEKISDDGSRVLYRVTCSETMREAWETAYEEDSLALEMARVNFTKGDFDDLDEESYAMRFPDASSMELAVNRPAPWEMLSFHVGGEIYAYDIEDDLSLSPSS